MIMMMIIIILILLLPIIIIIIIISENLIKIQKKLIQNLYNSIMTRRRSKYCTAVLSPAALEA
jgi:hypothetical protein